ISAGSARSSPTHATSCAGCEPSYPHPRGRSVAAPSGTWSSTATNSIGCNPGVASYGAVSSDDKTAIPRHASASTAGGAVVAGTVDVGVVVTGTVDAGVVV